MSVVVVWLCPHTEESREPLTPSFLLFDTVMDFSCEGPPRTGPNSQDYHIRV